MTTNQLFNGQLRISNIMVQRSRDTIYSILQRALAPSTLYNYAKNDSCIDYLKLYGSKYGYQPNQESDSNILLKQCGIRFEKDTFQSIEEMCEQHNLKCVRLPSSHTISFYDRYMETQSLLDRGVDVIIHGGVADLSNEIKEYYYLLLAVFIGGQIGNFLNLKLFSTKILALITSILVIFVAIRMGLNIFNI